MLLQRTLLPSLGQSLISESEMGISKRLYQLKMVEVWRSRPSCCSIRTSEPCSS
jgi:hypothetical protein